MEINTLGNVAEDARRTGDWDWMIRELELTRQHELDEAGAVVLDSSLAVFSILRGEFDDARLEELVARLNELEDRDVVSSVFDLRALRAMVHGQWALAVDELRTAASMSDYNAPYVLPRAGVAAILGRDVEAARAILADLESLSARGRAADADRAIIAAGIHALAGDVEGAVAEYRAVLATLRDLELDWDVALVGLQMLTTLGAGDADARAAGEAARPILARLRVTPVLAYLDRLLAGEPPVSRSARDERPAESQAGER